MDENKVIGGAKRVVGGVEATLGSITGDAATEIGGRVRQIGGKVQQSYGEAADALRTATVNQPITALLAAGLAGLVAGIIIARR